MGYAPHKRHKGCCAMCGWHTVRGQGWSHRAPPRVLRRFGRTRRPRRHDIRDQDR